MPNNTHSDNTLGVTSDAEERGCRGDLNSAPPIPSTKRRRRRYHKSGFFRAKVALQRAGVQALDGRSLEGRRIARWIGDIEADLGGQDELSTAQLTLIEAAAVTLALIHVADAALLELGHGALRRGHHARQWSFVPVVHERTRLVGQLRDLMITLGIERRPKPVKSLSELLAQPVLSEIPTAEVRATEEPTQ